MSKKLSHEETLAVVGKTLLVYFLSPLLLVLGASLAYAIYTTIAHVIG